MEVTAKLVNDLRAITGAPLMKCKTALVTANGDLAEAGRVLRQSGISATSTGRALGSEGYIALYAHPGNQIVSMVELGCDTDFVARSDAFRTVASELAIQVAATAPDALTPDDLPDAVRNEEYQVVKARTDGDPKTATKAPDLREQIARTRANKNLAERCLLTQEFVRDPDRTVGSLLDDLRLQVREGVHVRRFARWRVGETAATI
jgi:elongation factor Ts